MSDDIWEVYAVRYAEHQRKDGVRQGHAVCGHLVVQVQQHRLDLPG